MDIGSSVMVSMDMVDAAHTAPWRGYGSVLVLKCVA